MKLGKDFFFWLKILLTIIKAIVGPNNENGDNPGTAGSRAFTAGIGALITENEDDEKTANDLSPAKEKRNGTN